MSPAGFEDHVSTASERYAAHRFDLPAFYAEALRVLKPGGALDLRGYGRMALPD